MVRETAPLDENSPGGGAVDSSKTLAGKCDFHFSLFSQCAFCVCFSIFLGNFIFYVSPPELQFSSSCCPGKAKGTLCDSVAQENKGVGGRILLYRNQTGCFAFCHNGRVKRWLPFILSVCLMPVSRHEIHQPTSRKRSISIRFVLSPAHFLV